MKIYVSGKISGLPIEEAKQRFADSQALLESIGFEVVNPLEFGFVTKRNLGNRTWSRTSNCCLVVMPFT